MYVYFIRHADYVKIGRSANPEGRLAELQTGAPNKLWLLLKIKCRSELHATETERQVQQLFKFCRYRGEWYRISGVMKVVNRLKQIGGEVDAQDVKEHLWLAKMEHREKRIRDKRLAKEMVK